MTKDNRDIENVVIIGGGPSGLAAAIYLSRAGLRPVVFAGSPPGGQLTLTTEVENYPGFESVLGPVLVDKMRDHAKKFGTRIIDENIVKVDLSSKPFKVYPSGAGAAGSPGTSASTILIATGAKALWLGLESETRLRGKGVSACATCDAFFFKNKTVAVVGGGDTAIEEALTLARFAAKVYIIHRRDSFRASKIMVARALENPKIEIIWNTAVEEILGDKSVEAVKLKTRDSQSKILQLNGLFVAIGHRPDTDLFKDQIEVDMKGYIVTSAVKANEIAKLLNSYIGEKKPVETAQLTDSTINRFNFNFQSLTSIPGVFAAGDCVDHLYRQAGTASGMGIAAALEVERWLDEIN